MKDVGLVGVPYSGKSTLFIALTRAGAAGGRSNQAVVAVPDPRLGVLAALERSRRVVPAQVRFVDVPGGTSAQGLATLRQVDALCVVVRAFGPDPDPEAELAEVRTELVVADLGVVESAGENARKRAKGRSGGSLGDVETLDQVATWLSGDRMVRDLELDAAGRTLVRGLGLLTLKPWVVVANVEEGAAVPDGLPADTLVVSAAIEAETAGMPEDEAAALLAEFGVPERGLGLVIAACYRALDLVTFLTTSEDETRAWELRRRATAREAAGAIHSDLERGFIRAEVVSYEDVVAAGGWDAARHRGLMRVEGRHYEVREGDVLHIRFAL